MSVNKGSYEKLDVLGTGSFGKVYLAKNVRTKKLVVVKEVETKGFSATEREQALNEVAILGRCRHVNIIRYREAYVEGSILNIVMDHADEGDLQQKVEKAKWTYIKNETVIDWFVQISFALRHIHGLNILHRDLKTKNIFLTSNNTIKIGDFGIARMLSGTDAHAQTTVGTPYYISPEICQRLPYNHKSDMWSLGCVLYELCSLEHPFEATDLGSLVAKILDGRYKPIPRHCGPLLEDLVCVLLRAEAESRPSADQILCVPALRPYIQNYVRRMTGDKGLPGTPRPQGRRSSSVDLTPIPASFAETSMSPNEDMSAVNTSSVSEEEAIEMTDEENKPSMKKYEPSSPSPLTVQDDPVKAPVMQLCPRNPNLPGKEQHKKRSAAIDTGKENQVTAQSPVKRSLVGRGNRARSLTPPLVQNIVEKQKRIIRSAEVVRQAKLTLRGNRKYSPRTSLYKEVLKKEVVKKAPLLDFFAELQKKRPSLFAGPPSDVNCGKPSLVAGPPPGGNCGKVVPFARPGSSPQTVSTVSVHSTAKEADLKEISEALLLSVCLEQSEAFSKLENLRNFLEKKLTSSVLVRISDVMRSAIKNGKSGTLLEEKELTPFLPLVLQMVQLEAIAGN